MKYSNIFQRVRYQRTVELTLECEEPPGPEVSIPEMGERARRQLALGLEGPGGGLGTSPAIAQEVYEGVLMGTWIITDHFANEARRFLIAEPCRSGDNRALTYRERQVLELALRGHSNKFIGLEIGLTPSTVATHLRRTMVKLGLEGRETLIQTLLFAG